MVNVASRCDPGCDGKLQSNVADAVSMAVAALLLWKLPKLLCCSPLLKTLIMVMMMMLIKMYWSKCRTRDSY